MKTAIGKICTLSNPDWEEKRMNPNIALDEIHTIAVEAFFDDSQYDTDDLADYLIKYLSENGMALASLGQCDKLRAGIGIWLYERKGQRVSTLENALLPFAEVACWAERNGHDLVNDFDMLLRRVPSGNFAGHLGVQGRDFLHARSVLENKK